MLLPTSLPLSYPFAFCYSLLVQDYRHTEPFLLPSLPHYPTFSSAAVLVTRQPEFAFLLFHQTSIDLPATGSRQIPRHPSFTLSGLKEPYISPSPHLRALNDSNFTFTIKPCQVDNCDLAEPNPLMWTLTVQPRSWLL